MRLEEDDKRIKRFCRICSNYQWSDGSCSYMTFGEQEECVNNNICGQGGI